VLDGLPGAPHEIVFADDGSSDRSLALLREAARLDPRITVLELSRNFGHQAAIAAALDHVRGDVVAVIDGDLQDPPEKIPELLAHLAEGYDVVYAKRARRKEGPVLRACYWLAYRLVAAMSDVPLPLDSGDFAVMRREVGDHLCRLPEQKRYLRGLRAWVGFRQKGVEVERDRREAGDSKYSILKLARLALDGLFSFSVVPLRIFALFGVLAVLASVAYAAYAILTLIVGGATPRGFTALIVMITFLAGVQLLSLGVIGEYLARVYEEVKNRPPYVLRAIHRSSPDHPSAGDLAAPGRDG
jgi:dolichol-phosphate mannosyltransferase